MNEKKHKCHICFFKSSKIIVLNPCLHKFCSNCHEILKKNENYNCPICRTNIISIFFKNKNGNLINNFIKKPNLEINFLDFPPPISKNEWFNFLNKKWNIILQNIINNLIKINLFDKIIFSMIIGILKNNEKKDDSKKKINDLMKGLNTNFFEKIFNLQNIYTKG